MSKTVVNLVGAGLAFAAGALVMWVMTLPTCRQGTQHLVSPAIVALERADGFPEKAFEQSIGRCARHVGKGSEHPALDVDYCRRKAVDECVDGREEWKDCYRWAGEPVPEYLPRSSE